MQTLKPKPHKQVKAKNNSRIWAVDVCENCGKFTYLECHEVWGGIRRQISIKYKFQKRICNDCHRAITEHRTDINKVWQKEFQEQYIKENGRDAWFALMGKYYD